MSLQENLKANMKIHQKMISKDHEDSFWYEGTIAETEHFVLVATGDIRIYDTKTDSMYDNEPRDNFRFNPQNDTELHKMTEDEDITWELLMNNWFEIYGKEGSGWGEICDNYTEAIAQLKKFEDNYKLTK